MHLPLPLRVTLGTLAQVWSLQGLPELRAVASYRAHNDGVISAVLLGGGSAPPLAASCDLEGALHVWDTATARTLEVA